MQHLFDILIICKQSIHCLLQEREALILLCPQHVKQLLSWVGSNPRLMVAALSILSFRHGNAPFDLNLCEFS